MYKLRVYYEDTDAGGIVYHSNYINFCERARSEAFFENGVELSSLSGQFVARKLEADYIKSAKLGDLLEVKSSLVQMKSASCILEQNIYKDEEKIFSMQITLAFVSHEGKPTRMDKRAKDLILLLS